MDHDVLNIFKKIRFDCINTNYTKESLGSTVDFGHCAICIWVGRGMVMGDCSQNNYKSYKDVNHRNSEALGLTN